MSKCLYVLMEHANLENPENVKTFVATYDRKNGYKRNLIMAYEHYVKLYGLTWTKPRYHETAKMPKIPHESKIEAIMANASPKLATALAISKDTGLRPVELMRITLRNPDLQNGAIYPETAKHGSPRVLKLSNKTLNMVNKYYHTETSTLTNPYSEHGQARHMENGLDTTATKQPRNCKTHQSKEYDSMTCAITSQP